MQGRIVTKNKKKREKQKKQEVKDSQQKKEGIPGTERQILKEEYDEEIRSKVHFPPIVTAQDNPDGVNPDGVSHICVRALTSNR